MLAALTVLALQSATPATPYLFTGGSLQATCAKEGDLDLGLCVGYLSAAVDEAVFRDTSASPHRLCVPSTLTNAQLRSLLLASLAKETNGLRLPATLYVQKALAAAYACPASGPR